MYMGSCPEQYKFTGIGFKKRFKSMKGAAVNSYFDEFM